MATPTAPGDLASNGALGLLSLLGAYLLNQAYALGPLALVTTTSSIQPILILLMVSLVNTIRPRTIPNEGSRCFSGAARSRPGL